MVAYEDQIRCCKSWLQGQQGEDLEKGDRDLDGHGTHCASLILQVAQNVSLYVARVFKSRTEKTGPVEVQETQEAIAKVRLLVPSGHPAKNPSGNYARCQRMES